MSIVYISVDEAAEVGELPRTNKMITTDSLSVITTANYLNRNNTSGRQIFPTDVWHIQYSYTGNSFAQQAGFGTGTFGIFTTTISTAGEITLVQWVDPAGVALPVISGDIPVFTGTTGEVKDSGVAFSNLTDTVSPLFHGTAVAGHFVTVNNADKTIQDSGAAPSAASQPFVVMSPGSLTSGNIPFLNDVNGTLNTGRSPSAATAGYKVVMSPGSLTVGHFPALADVNGTINNGLPPSAAAQAFVVVSPGSLTSGNLMKLADANGTIADQGVAMKSVAKAAVAGGAAAQTVTDAFCTTGSSVIASWNDQTNPASILTVAAGSGSFVVTSSADPGASHLNYVIYK